MPRKQLTKKAFVAGLPTSLSPTEVVAKGKTLNIDLKPRQVINIRSKLRTALKRGEAAAPANGPRLRRKRIEHTSAIVIPSPPNVTTVIDRSVSKKDRITALRAIALQLGLAETRRALDDFEAEIMRPTS